MAAVKILVIPGSVRESAADVRLAAAIVKEVALADHDATRISLADFPLPLHDDAEDGTPYVALDLKRMIGAHHAVLLVTPERHALPPPLLLNTLDWLASVRERSEPPLQALRDKPFAIAAVSDRNDGIYAALTLRQMLIAGCGADVIAPQLIVARGNDAFDRMDRLQDDGEFAAMQAVVRALIDAAQRKM
ncbi:FMN-dependent NADPH-azoreductase OS=Afipia felis OX=1035 GN=azr_2 PE=4 SV=1 [Afipia felis]